MKKSPPPRILILTGSFGHGHNTAAHNLASAFRQLLGEGQGGSVEVVDFFQQAYPKTNALLRRGYAFAITRVPAIWNGLYRLTDGEGASLVPLGAMARRLKIFLEARRPHAVVTTFPGFPMLMEELYPDGRERPFAFFTVVTDAISINALWTRGRPEGMFVSDLWSKSVVTEMGIDAERVHAHGFPLRLVDAEWAHAMQDHDPLPALPNGPIRVLYLPTTKTAHVRETLEALLPWVRAREASLTLVLGTHEERLRPLVEKLAKARGAASCLTVLGWRDDVPLLMRQSHLCVSKAGGATVAETLGAQCPVLLNHVVPGQEEGNRELILRSDCGCHEEDPRALPAVLDALLVDEEAAQWKRFKKRLRHLERAEASSRIVRDVLDVIGEVSKDPAEVQAKADGSFG